MKKVFQCEQKNIDSGSRPPCKIFLPRLPTIWEKYYYCNVLCVKSTTKNESDKKYEENIQKFVGSVFAFWVILYQGNRHNDASPHKIFSEIEKW